MQKNSIGAVLASIVIYLIAIQNGNGSAFWVYCGEVANATANGLCVFVLMGVLLIQSLTTATLIDAMGVAGLFYTLGGIQFIIAFIFHLVMKETKGLTIE